MMLLARLWLPFAKSNRSFVVSKLYDIYFDIILSQYLFSEFLAISVDRPADSSRLPAKGSVSL